MKIITWNCNLKFKQKFELISSYDPDICFVQECENLNTDFFPGYKFFWTGRNENKGLGILTKGDDFIIDESHNKNLINLIFSRLSLLNNLLLPFNLIDLIILNFFSQNLIVLTVIF